jgi:sterol desaturase/sphingolipid hydroxylase (fatty acid hydroxylase superfamily)
MFDTTDPFFLTRLFGVVLVVALAWELLWPRRAESPDLRFRWVNNISLTAIGQLISHGIHIAVVAVVAIAVEYNVTGVLSDPGVPWLLAFAITLLVLDCAGYVLHAVMHKVGWLWRLHAVHHSDTSLDLTSTYRHHPGEIMVTAAVSLPILLLLAPPASVYVVYQALRMSLNVFQHCNVRIPEPVERILRRVLVTPDFHRLHHSSDRRHTDSNYGGVLPWFDYLFRTASSRPYAEQETMELGLEYFRERRDSRLDQLLLVPFTWHREVSSRDPVAVADRAAAAMGSRNTVPPG